MKTLLTSSFSLAFGLLLLISPVFVSAAPADSGAGAEDPTQAGSYLAGHACATDDDCSSNLACINKACAIDPSLDSSAAPVTGANQSTSAVTGTGFTPLTNLPGLKDLSDASNSSFPVFINSLYKICIGVAAVLAVIIIMKAGVEFMTNTGSISHNEKAKNDLQNAILGLVLVLSPTIVFGIINPQILNLKLNFESLQPTAIMQTSAAPDPGDGTCSVDCGVGLICKNKACVANSNTTPSSCSTPIASGSVITDAQVGCCAAQTGCTAIVKPDPANFNGTGIRSCICSSPK